MEKAYDYLIVGAGLYGSVLAYELTKRNKKVLVLEKRDHIAGNIYTENINGINVHKYGAHIFHTSNEKVWNYINQFAKFNNFVNSPIANFNGELYNLPFNMNTFTKLWADVLTPKDAMKKIAKEKEEVKDTIPTNLEEQAISLVGRTIYEKLIKGYTEKQWGKACANLPAFIIRRLPVRFTFNNNYFNDCYQGIPRGGYTKIIEKMLEKSEVKLNTDYLKEKDYYDTLASKIIFTGQIDEYFNYKLGKLEYRSLEFVMEILEDVDNYQGNAVVNYTDSKTPYTRIIEHKHFEFNDCPTTVITREYPQEYTEGTIAYYPVNDETNNLLYQEYKAMADKEKQVYFGGRLGLYQYYDMDKIIERALDFVQELLM